MTYEVSSGAGRANYAPGAHCRNGYNARRAFHGQDSRAAPIRPGSIQVYLVLDETGARTSPASSRGAQIGSDNEEKAVTRLWVWQVLTLDLQRRRV